LHGILNGRHAGHAAHQQHLINVRRAQLGIGHGLLARTERLFDQILHQLLQLGASQGHLQVFGAAGIGSDKGQVQLALHRRR